MENTRSLIAHVKAGRPFSSLIGPVPYSTITMRIAKEEIIGKGSGRGDGGGGGHEGGVAGRARRSSGTPGPGAEGGLIMLVRVVCSCLRNLGYPRSRLLALNMLVACGRCCNDEARRKRLVPFTMAMREDPEPVVRATAVLSERALLATVTSLPPGDYNPFSLHIFPAIQVRAPCAARVVPALTPDMNFQGAHGHQHFQNNQRSSHLVASEHLVERQERMHLGECRVRRKAEEGANIISRRFRLLEQESQAFSASNGVASPGFDPSSLAGQERWLSERPGAIKDSFIEGLRRSGAAPSAVDVANNALGWELNYAEQLGAGTFGDVFKVVYAGSEYAVKVAKEGIPQAAVSQRVEAMVLKRATQSTDKNDEECMLRAQHVVRLVGLDDANPQMPILLELAHGDLWDVVTESAKFDLAFDQILRMAIGMTLGIEFIHGMGVVHCDIKPSNILLVRKPNGEVVPKIADFGGAKGVGELRKRFTGTLGYIPLECMINDGPAMKEADFFAAGVVAVMVLLHKSLRHHNLFFSPRLWRREDTDAVNQLYEVGQQHGPAMDALESSITLHNVESDAVRLRLLLPGNLREEVPTSERNRVCELLGSSLKPDPADRPSLSELRDHLEHLRTKVQLPASASPSATYSSLSAGSRSARLPAIAEDDGENVPASAVSLGGGGPSHDVTHADSIRLDPVPLTRGNNEDSNEEQPVSPQVTPPTHVSRFLGFIPSALRCRIGPHGDYSRKLPRLSSVAKQRKRQGSSTPFRDSVEEVAHVPVTSNRMIVKAEHGWFCNPMENCTAGAAEEDCAGVSPSTMSSSVAIEPLLPATRVFPPRAQAWRWRAEKHSRDASARSETTSIGGTRSLTSTPSLDGILGEGPRVGKEGRAAMGSLSRATTSNQCSIPCPPPSGFVQSPPRSGPIMSFVGPPPDLALCGRLPSGPIMSFVGPPPDLALCGRLPSDFGRPTGSDCTKLRSPPPRLCAMPRNLSSQQGVVGLPYVAENGDGTVASLSFFSKPIF